MEKSLFDWAQTEKSEHRRIADAAINRFRSIIDTEIKEVLSGDAHLSVAASMAATSGGKRLRPIICLLSCEAAGTNYEVAIPVAVSFELAHIASLIQDDIIDQSDTRHNEVTVNRRYGSVRAILISDYLLFTIFGETSKYGKKKNVRREAVSSVLSCLSNSAIQAASGEFNEMLLITKGDVTEEEYLELAGLKTGALYAGASASGAIVARGSKKLIDAMRAYGYYLGLSYQILDDILDFVGDPRSSGKPLFIDLKNNAVNIVTIHALSKADRFDKNSMHSLLLRQSYSQSGVKKILSILRKSGSIEYASSLAEKYASLARSQLRILKESQAKKELESITYSILSPLYEKAFAKEQQQPRQG